MVEMGAVTVSGVPVAQLKIPPNCHRSTSRWTRPADLPRNGRFGPNGSSTVPLLVNMWVRWKPSSALFNDLFLGSRYVTPPSVSFSPRARLHVYAVELVRP